MEGKTVERVEYGFREPISNVHQSEVMILSFTDGSILGIDTGSNAAALASAHEGSGLHPDDFHVDMDLRWVQPSEQRE